MISGYRFTGVGHRIDSLLGRKLDDDYAKYTEQFEYVEQLQYGTEQSEQSGDFSAGRRQPEHCQETQFHRYEHRSPAASSSQTQCRDSQSCRRRQSHRQHFAAHHRCRRGFLAFTGTIILQFLYH